jgi:hypothetical protein
VLLLCRVWHLYHSLRRIIIAKSLLRRPAVSTFVWLLRILLWRRSEWTMSRHLMVPAKALHYLIRLASPFVNFLLAISLAIAVFFLNDHS